MSMKLENRLERREAKEGSLYPSFTTLALGLLGSSAMTGTYAYALAKSGNSFSEMDPNMHQYLGFAHAAGVPLTVLGASNFFQVNEDLPIGGIVYGTFQSIAAIVGYGLGYISQ